MGLDPQVQKVLDQIAAIGAPDLHTLPVPEARTAMAAMAGLQGQTEAVAHVEDRTLPGPGDDIAIRLYTPDRDRALPLLVYFHGGGWVLGSIDTHDALCRALANAAGCAVVSVEYRLAPEHPFPAAPEDAYAATRWIAENAAALGGDATRIAVGGDSAGGNLAAVVALMAREQGGPRLRHQLLIYPVTDAAFDTLSARENAEGYLLTSEAMRWFWNHYCPDVTARGDWRASPVRAPHFRGLPPAHVIPAEFDPLRDEGEAYAAHLRAADVPVRCTRYDGMIHGFFSMGGVVARGRAAVGEAVRLLRAAFGERTATGSAA
jgi:acetyl esterase